MNFISKCPDKVKKLMLLPGENTEIDTCGLYCKIKPENTMVYVKAKPGESEEDAFPVDAEEIFDFCGKITVFAKEKATLNLILYTVL